MGAAVIAGIGIDLIELARIERAIDRYGERFLVRLLTPAERSAARGPFASFVAARWAAKEAALKALGTGLTGGMTWRDVEVLDEPSGAPRMVLHGLASRRAQALGVTSALVSLTHDQEHAAAVVVLEGASPPTAPACHGGDARVRQA